MSKNKKEAAFKVFASYDFFELYNKSETRNLICKTIDVINGDVDAESAYGYWIEYKNQNVHKIRDEAYRLAKLEYFVKANEIYNSLLDDQNFKITFSSK